MLSAYTRCACGMLRHRADDCADCAAEAEWQREHDRGMHKGGRCATCGAHAQLYQCDDCGEEFRAPGCSHYELDWIETETGEVYCAHCQ